MTRRTRCARIDLLSVTRSQ